MKYILERIRNCRLKVRLSLPVAIALIMLLVSQWVVYLFCISVVNRNMQSSVGSAAISVRSHVDTQIRNVIERMYYTRLDASVEEYLTDYLLREDDATEAITNSMLSYALSLQKAAEPMIASVLIYTPKHTFSGVGIPMIPDYDFEKTLLWQLLQEENGAMIFAPPMRDEAFLLQQQVVPLVFRFRITGYPENCAIVFNLDQQKLDAYVQEAVIDSEAGYLLVTESGQVISGSKEAAAWELTADEEGITQVLESETVIRRKLSDENYLISSSALEAAPWRIIYMQSMEPYMNTLMWIRICYCVITIMTVVLTLWVLLRSVETVTKPLEELCRQIQLWETENKSQEFIYPYQDEIGVLARNYNSMAFHIQCLQEEQIRYIHLLEEEKARADEEQALKRRAELTALQAQMTPHFLYNTLDSIRWKAERAGEEEISRMITALATLFRIALSRGREIISVEQELRHVESYLMIQKMRYSDRMNYTMDVDPAIMKLATVKLILQPLVENAIYHGIKESAHSGNVTVKGSRIGDVLQLQVIDNGQGIPQAKLALLQADLAKGRSVSREGYGIFNVNERIRLHFGPEYGLELESEWGKGTVSTVRLPCSSLLEEENEVSNFDRR